jgi:hypothetical protein
MPSKSRPSAKKSKQFSCLSSSSSATFSVTPPPIPRPQWIHSTRHGTVTEYDDGDCPPHTARPHRTLACLVPCCYYYYLHPLPSSSNDGRWCQRNERCPPAPSPPRRRPQALEQLCCMPLCASVWAGESMGGVGERGQGA